LPCPFHVFSDDDRRRYIEGLASVLKPGGRLFLLCFSDEEPGAKGPRRVSAKEIRYVFAVGWAVESKRRLLSAPLASALWRIRKKVNSI
jgi:cyclopropane fatty-acyl-phospholipid synthase-like methyltransferase